MDKKSKEIEQTEENSQKTRRPIAISALAILLGLTAIVSLIGAMVVINLSEEGGLNSSQVTIIAIIAASILTLLAWGVWNLKDWARLILLVILVLAGASYAVSVMFEAAEMIFSGSEIVPWGEIFKIMGISLLRIFGYGLLPIGAIYGLSKYSSYFVETAEQRELVNRSVRYVLIVTALSSIFIVFLIIFFTANESKDSVAQVGILEMIFGAVWRPGSIIGTADAQLGMLPMIAGSFLSTLGAVILGVPLSLLTAILLSEVAPPTVREILHPLIELLAGIPSVVYGLFGMVVLAPLIRHIEVSGNNGYNLLNASIILAVMIIPTITNITEDAINAVPKIYKEGALALGATHWQTIYSVILPAARSGILAAIILGIGRALGETMALIMVIGNAIAMPSMLSNNPLSIFLSSARTLTGNIAVEINYAAGAHRSALFFSGVLLFAMLLLVNSMARYLMRERLRMS